MQLVLGELRAAARLTEEPVEHTVAGQPGQRSVIRRVPVSVVGVLSPWNFPMVLAIHSVAPGLPLGNAVVLKADPHTLVSAASSCPRFCTRPSCLPDSCPCSPGGAEAGHAVCEAPEVGMLSFTGSTAVGRLIGTACGRKVKRDALELGGNDTFIVLEDADMAAARSAGAWGSFLHQGQICMTAGRHLVHERVADVYIEVLAARAGHLGGHSKHR